MTTTIAPHLALATALTARHLSFLRLSVSARAAAQRPGGGGTATLLTLVAVGASLAAVTSASRALAAFTRALAALFAEGLRVALAMAWAWLLMIFAVIAAVALLIHH